MIMRLLLLILSNSCLLSMYTDMCPVLNHPSLACAGKEVCKSPKSVTESWLLRALKPAELRRIHEFRNSPKFIILAHILVMASEEKSKVLICSKCLLTLTLVEEFLASNWKEEMHSLAKDFPHLPLGGLKKNRDFVRIDGSVESGKRGALVKKFCEDDEIKIFLISSRAGGIGINLVRIPAK